MNQNCRNSDPPTSALAGREMELSGLAQQQRALCLAAVVETPGATAREIEARIGIMQPRDSVELHNLPLVITVKCKKRDDTGEITNEIKGYEKTEAGVAKGQRPQAPVTDNTPPWKR